MLHALSSNNNNDDSLDTEGATEVEVSTSWLTLAMAWQSLVGCGIYFDEYNSLILFIQNCGTVFNISGHNV